MTSTFATQLRTIAANSTNELDLRARREAHAESLIFDRGVAVKQDWEAVYQICLEGFQELCLLDSRLRDFEQNLYSPQAKTQDREQLSKSQNEALGIVLERCLGLLAAKVMLRPGVKAIEWLVRRFRVHVYNTGIFLATFLPYHETPVFRNALSIVPSNKIVGEWKFLGPYHKIAANVPRHAVVYSATHNDAFFSFFNNFILRVCQEGAGNSQLLRFWGSLVVEAATGRLSQVKSGRKEVRKQRLEDALLKIFPVLTEGFEIRGCEDLTLTCFTLTLVLASNADLEDHVIDSLIKAILPFITNGDADAKSPLVSLAILVASKADLRVPKDVLDVFMKMGNINVRLFELKGQIPLDPLCEALINSSFSGLKKSNIDSRFGFVEKLFDVISDLFQPSAPSRFVAATVRKLQSTKSTDSFETSVRTRLIRILQKLSDSPTFSSTFSQAVLSTGQSLAEAEAIIEGTIDNGDRSLLVESVPMDVEEIRDASISESDAAGTMLAALPSQSTELSFLAAKRSPLFDQIAQAFTLCHRSVERLTQFEDLPLWQQKTEKPSDLHASFLLRVACGAFRVPDRAAALQILSRTLDGGSRQDSQLFIPYFTVLLSDDAQIVRKAAVACVIAVQKCVLKHLEGGNSHQEESETIYDAVAMANLKRIPPRQANQLLNQVYLPNLEESILDASHIRKTLEAAFDSPARTLSLRSKTAAIELKKSLKHTLFELLSNCALTCPLLRVKMGVIGLLIEVHKIGSTTTSKTFSPILEEWASLKTTDAEAGAALEGLPLSQIDAVLVQLINVHDKQAVEQVLDMLAEGKINPRADLTAAFFARIATIWKAMRLESQISAAVRLFDMAFSKNQDQATGSRHVLHTATLSTDMLATILDHAYSGLAQMQTDMPPKKRRRISHGRESIPKEMMTELDAADSRLMFALELVENSKPEAHPQLLGSLFEVLIILRRLRDQSTSESPYLLTLCLSSILAIVDKARESRKPNIDISIIRADLVTDCVRSSDNPQVQSTALLLAASLASLAPDRILHTIMPIFTFMGRKVLSKDDERSIYVINQAIDQIIPPLVSTLKRQDAVKLLYSTSSLLSSFITAYDHIPQHRRDAFYQRLLKNLGPDDFSFAVVALFASRRYPQDMSSFFSNLITNLPAATQLLTFRKIIDLVIDIFSETPYSAESLLNISTLTKNEKREREASILLEVASRLLEPKGLKTEVKRLHTETEREHFWAEFKTSISQLLGMLDEQKTRHQALASGTRKCLSTLLALPSLAELLRIIPDLLRDMEQVGDQELQPLALRVLATQLKHNPPKDANTRSEAMSFLPTIEKIIRNTQDEAMRHASIACLDRIVEVYGRKSTETVISYSSTLIDGESGLGSQDLRTQIMSLLCLTSMMEVLKEAAVPIVLQALPKVFDLLRSSFEDNASNTELHNAAFRLMSSFISHVPFMVSDDNVSEILEISYCSCAAKLDASSKESRVDALNLLAQKLDLITITSSLNQAWRKMPDNIEVEAITEYLDLLSSAIERNPKSAVIRAADKISEFILRVLDMRRVASSTSPEVIDSIESKLSSISIAFIYKLNDTTFRPLFEIWIDWAVKGSGVDEYTDRAKTARLTSFFHFATHFFATLKSIVTSYASYILAPTAEILRFMTEPSKNATLDDTLALYKSTMTLLTTISTHDADGFFASPSHFSALSELLVQQLTLSASKSKPLRLIITNLVIPTIVSFATAIQDTPSHHHTLNHHICQLRHHASPSVRLSSIQTQMTLTESEDVGGEWINNVVLGQTSAEGGVGGSGETMVYVNEMLEDEDEGVETEVRNWVRKVREMVGEDVFEL